MNYCWLHRLAGTACGTNSIATILVCVHNTNAATDAGITWKIQNVTIADMYAVSVDCVAPPPGQAGAGNCWSSLLDVLTQETSVASLY